MQKPTQYKPMYALLQEGDDEPYICRNSIIGLGVSLPNTIKVGLSKLSKDDIIRKVLLKDDGYQSTQSEGMLLAEFEGHNEEENLVGNFKKHQIVRFFVPVYPWQTENQDSVSTQ